MANLTQTHKVTGNIRVGTIRNRYTPQIKKEQDLQYIKQQINPQRNLNRMGPVRQQEGLTSFPSKEQMGPVRQKEGMTSLPPKPPMVKDMLPNRTNVRNTPKVSSLTSTERFLNQLNNNVKNKQTVKQSSKKLGPRRQPSEGRVNFPPAPKVPLNIPNQLQPQGMSRPNAQVNVRNKIEMESPSFVGPRLPPQTQKPQYYTTAEQNPNFVGPRRPSQEIPRISVPPMKGNVTNPNTTYLQPGIAKTIPQQNLRPSTGNITLQQNNEKQMQTLPYVPLYMPLEDFSYERLD